MRLVNCKYFFFYEKKASSPASTNNQRCRSEPVGDTVAPCTVLHAVINCAISNDNICTNTELQHNSSCPIWHHCCFPVGFKLSVSLSNYLNIRVPMEESDHRLHPLAGRAGLRSKPLAPMNGREFESEIDAVRVVTNCLCVQSA